MRVLCCPVRTVQTCAESPERRRVPSSHQESSRFDPSQTHKDAAETSWLTHNGGRGNVHTTAESSPVQSGSVYAHGSCRITSLNTACFIFVIRVPVIGRNCRYFALRNEFRKVHPFTYGPPGNLRCLLYSDFHSLHVCWVYILMGFDSTRLCWCVRIPAHRQIL
jgi:hypothetical protein